MAAMAGSSTVEGQNPCIIQTPDRLKILYPAVNEEETTLPRSWSPKDKYNFIGLSQNNLRVHYKGNGRNHRDAASVRATHPIPASCGIYYFEVKIISKGRDGYMGIGLSAQGVNMNRLPGWDKHSYGYHGDDGHSFCCSGTGQPYGPTFTTGDVIGCCVNLIDNTCFYTKNGVNLGVAFRDLPGNLYPTVGLQTPGEVVEANFGQTCFVFDLEDYMKEWRMKTRMTIERFPVPDKKGEWQTALQQIVSTYLVHHGYCATAESFARHTGQSFEEELASIKHRQEIQKLVLAGRMGEAIETTQKLYPGLLERNTNLLFTLKCRQFIEMVNGTDSEVRIGGGVCPMGRSPKSRGGSNRSTPNMSPVHPSVSYTLGQRGGSTTSSAHSSPGHTTSPHIISPPIKTSSSSQSSPAFSPPASSGCSSQSGTSSNASASSQGQRSVENNRDNLGTISEEEQLNAMNAAINGSSGCDGDDGGRIISDSDVEMEIGDSDTQSSRTITNGTSNGVYLNGNDTTSDHDEDMDVDTVPRRQLCGGSQVAVEKMLQFGRELHVMSENLKREHGSNEGNKKALRDAFSLLAYSDPWTSPVGFQLDPVQREPVCAALNSAILESHGLPKQPPLELAMSQATECMRLMSKSGIGSCAFASVADYLH